MKGGDCMENEINGSSPVLPAEYDFFKALEQLSVGRQISRKEWGNKQIYGVLRDNKVMLHKDDDQFYDWIISAGDLAGTDWFIIIEN